MEEFEVVDPITQLLMMLVWDEEYTDEFKRQVIRKAIFQAQMENVRQDLHYVGIV
jgi:hypothetical protein